MIACWLVAWWFVWRLPGCLGGWLVCVGWLVCLSDGHWLVAGWILSPPAGHTALDFLAGSPLDSPTTASTPSSLGGRHSSPGGHHRRGRPGRLEASFRTFSIVRYCGSHDHRLSLTFHDSWLLVLPQVVARDRAHATQRPVRKTHQSISQPPGEEWF